MSEIIFDTANKDDIPELIRLRFAYILMMAYLLFDYILGNIRGSFVYGFFTPEEVGIVDIETLWKMQVEAF